MRGYRIRIAAWMALMTFLSLSTASARVQWIEKDHDFGLMKEVAGPQTGVSRFVNLGPDTISIFNVRPSCGCTSADWSDAPVAPGDTACVAYTYDPYMRPGRFDKSVKVQLSDGSRHSIRITGNVYGTPESLATLYPLPAGDLRLSEVAINMGEVKFGRSPVAFVNAYALTPDSLAPSVTSPAKALSVSPSVDTAGPGDLITYTLTYDSRSAGEYGPVAGDIVFRTPGGEGRLPWKAFVVPDSDRLLLAQQGKNPVCEPLQRVIDLGVVDNSPGASPLAAEFEISNPGKGPLDIYRIVCGNPAIEIKSAPLQIKPGKKARVRLIVNSSQLLTGPARIPITLLTSDPQNPRIDIHAALNAR